MTKKPLYKYGDSVGPRRKAKVDSIHGYRLIADENRILSEGVHFVECVDVFVDEVDNWKEVEVFSNDDM